MDFFPYQVLLWNPLLNQCSVLPLGPKMDGWEHPHTETSLCYFAAESETKKQRGLTLQEARLTNYGTHSSLWLQNVQMHQAPEHVMFTEAQTPQWSKSTVNKVSVEHPQRFLNILPNWRLASSKPADDYAGHCKKALWKAELKWGDYFCVQRTPEDCVSSQAAILIWWCKKAFNVRDRQALIVCIH